MISDEPECFDDEYLDDPITLIDFEQARINGIYQNIDGSTTDARHPESSQPMTCNIVSSYGNNHFTLPVTFFDILSNISLLRECRPVAIKVVDCDKHPRYYRKYKVNKNVTAEALLNNGEDSTERQVDANECKIPNGIIFKQGQRMEYFKSRDELLKKIALKQKDVSQIDFKRNMGLIGLKITPLMAVSRPKSSSNKHKNTVNYNKETNVDSYILGVDKVLNDIGTTIIPLNNNETLKSNERKSNKPKMKTNFYKKKLMERKRQKEIKLLNQNGTTMVPDITPVKFGNNVKDKTKTNKYMNDLLKKKLANENKTEPSDKNNICSTKDNDCMSSLIGQRVENSESLKNQPLTPIDPGIKSPVLPCNNKSLKFNKIKPKDNVTNVDNKTENCSSKEFPTIGTVDVIESGSRVSSRADAIEVPKDTQLIKEQNLTQNTLKDITISSVMNVPKKVQSNNVIPDITLVATSSNTTGNVNVKETGFRAKSQVDPITVLKDIQLTKEHSLSQHTVKDVMISTETSLPKNAQLNNINLVTNSNNTTVYAKETGSHADSHKVDPIKVTKDSQPIKQHNLTQHTFKGITISNVRSVPKNAQINSPITDINLAVTPHPIAGNVIQQPDKNHDITEKTKYINNNVTSNNKGPVMGTNVVSTQKQPDKNHDITEKTKYINNNVTSNNKGPGSSIITVSKDNTNSGKKIFRYVPPNQRVFPGINNYYSPVHPHIQSRGGGYNAVHSVASSRFWPYWPPPPPPPPPPPAPLICQNTLPENQQQGAQTTRVEVVTGYGKNRIIDSCGGSDVNPNNIVASANRELKDVPTSETEPVNSKSEMLKELDKEIMAVPDLPMEDSTEKLIHVVNIVERPKTSPEKDGSKGNALVFSNIRHDRPGPKTFKHIDVKNDINSQPKCTLLNVNGNFMKEKSKSEVFKGSIAASHTQDKIESSIATSNNNKKDPYRYLIGTKVNLEHPKIAPIRPIAGCNLISKDPRKLQIGDKAATDKPNISKGYSPPILPIPTYEKSLEILYSGNPESQSQSSYLHRGKSINNIPIESFYLPSNKKIQSSGSKVERKRHYDSMKASKKISLEEYKERAGKSSPQFQGTTDTLPSDYKRSKCNRKNFNASKGVKSLAELINPSPDQDLGYDSDSTVKL